VPFNEHAQPLRAGLPRVTIPDFDSTSDDVWLDPDGVLRQLRLRDPVHWSAVEQSWIITRHADALAVLRDDRAFRSDPRIASGAAGALVSTVSAVAPLPYDALISSTDGAVHSRIRRAAARTLSPASIDALRPAIRDLADRILLAAPGQALDAIGQFARPLALSATLRLIGVTADAARFHRLAELLMLSTQFGYSEQRTEENAVRAREELAELLDSISAPPASLLASLRDARDAGRISTDEFAALLVFTTTVGQAPTVFALGNALLTLLRNQPLLNTLRKQPGLVSNLLDESVRLNPPLRVIRRFAAVDKPFHGRNIRSGDQLQIIVSAVNRDPDVYREPSRFDLNRRARNHLGFGWGSHHCLGAPLARAIAEEGFSALLQQFPHLAAGANLELMVDETSGPTLLEVVGRAGAPASLLESARNNDIAHRSVPVVPCNHACPCGSGRKYKHCHGARSRGRSYQARRL